MPLTAVALKNRSKVTKNTKMSDGEGLYVLLTPAGGCLWRFNYRFGGAQKTLALGEWPALSIPAAREAMRAAKLMLKEGRDPALHKRLFKNEQKDVEERFETIARRWYKSRLSGWSRGYAKRILSRMEGDLFPDLGGMPIKMIEPPLMLEVIRKIEARDAPEMAKRVKNYASEVFQFAIAEGRASRDPTADIQKALVRNKPVKRRAALKANDLPEFLVKLDAYDGDARTRLGVLLTVHTMLRTAETRFAVEEEFEDLDGSAPLWRIPGPRMKMKVEHLVPLSRQAAAIVKEVLALPRPGNKLFWSSVAKEGVISENTMLFALYRMGYHSRATIHGFRGTASTVLNESGRFESDWIERQLAHVELDEIRRAYNSAQWLKPRREMMQWWSDYLDRQRGIGGLLD